MTNRHIFHYLVEDQLIYLCMTDNDLKRRVPFMFLEDMKARSLALSLSVDCSH